MEKAFESDYNNRRILVTLISQRILNRHLSNIVIEYMILSPHELYQENKFVFDKVTNNFELLSESKIINGLQCIIYTLEFGAGDDYYEMKHDKDKSTLIWTKTYGTRCDLLIHQKFYIPSTTTIFNYIIKTPLGYKPVIARMDKYENIQYPYYIDKMQYSTDIYKK